MVEDFVLTPPPWPPKCYYVPQSLVFKNGIPIYGATIL